MCDLGTTNWLNIYYFPIPDPNLIFFMAEYIYIYSYTHKFYVYTYFYCMYVCVPLV